MSWHIRPAVAQDAAAIEELIARSIRTLGAADYSSQQIEGALKGAFGLDSQLIADGTYFVVEAQGRLLGCGGWSYRRTLFGGDARSGRDAGTLDPRSDAARIRAFFVDPDAARSGIGSALLEHCEAQARRHGFRRAQMMATLPGVRLYSARGYVPGASVRYPLAEGLSIEFVPMGKSLATAPE
ncbi:MAG TPA: GNAT family N-acetyltransferase [Steroidobacteraceae bacterium]|nr:GNAT family N-acetyltransferase [Steroidobacteraceae bacterium]